MAEPVVDNSRELAEEASAKAEIAELRAQIKELMSQPAQPVVTAAPIVQKSEQVYSEPETNVRIDRKARHVGGY